MLHLALLALLLGLCVGEEQETNATAPDYSRGWGDGIDWFVTFDKALLDMMKSKRPLMAIYHREDDQSCQELKAAFAVDKSIQNLAKSFIMVNVPEETSALGMAPDGFYVPRIIFLDPSMSVRRDLKSKKGEKVYSYGPGDLNKLYKNMKKAKSGLRLEL